jgi:hypothetical protein
MTGYDKRDENISASILNILKKSNIMGQKSLESMGFYGTFVVVIAGLCNGSTADSESACLGSNPSPATNFPLLFRGVHS